MSKLALVKCSNYSNVKSVIQKSLDLINFKFSKGQRILLKPNLFGPKANSNAVTNINVIRVVCELIIEAGAYPTIGELVANDELNVNKIAFKQLGIIDLAKELGVKLSDFQTNKFIPIKVKNPLAINTVYVASAMFDYDVVINLPKFKGHGCTFITGAIKNSFGCVKPNQRTNIHMNCPDLNFHKAVVDVYSVMPFNLTIMDAIIGMDGKEAPAYGDECKIGAIITSIDSVSVDSIASVITGHNLNFLPVIKYAHLKHIGEMRPSKIEILGNSIDDFKSIKFNHHPNYLSYVNSVDKNNIVNNNLNNDKFPYVDNSCNYCLTCYNNCPAKAIINDGNNSKIYVDYKKCICCYKCLEVCPNGSMKPSDNK